MRQQETLQILVSHQSTLMSFGVRLLMLFGAVARDEARTDSDVDLLVEL
ncbi:MAG TPA: nucleotidyltransferase domain-containing protein [Leptolyngbyaceae cyanobacterium]